MSLFSSLGQGDIWSISGISFASPVNDILDKDFFTLEELLEEEDLLQEVKSKNENLLLFLQKEETVQKLVEYVITSTDANAGDLRLFKYPYMACELFCCEIQKMLDVLVENQEGKLLGMLFSLLDNDAPLDHYLAGYFEKILEMLFRRMTVPVMSYLNRGGIPLLQKFLNHIENYSVMQIVQRVMLPHIPFSMDDVEEMTPEDRLVYQCNWSFQKDTCYLLCSRMLEGGSCDIPPHISDLLITVLQLSPHDSLFLTHLCEPQCLDDILKFSFQDYAERTSVTDAPSMESSLSLASIAVLESLVSRLCETMNPFEGGEEHDQLDDTRNTMALIGECVDKVSLALIEYVPKCAAQLSAYSERDVCGTFEAQSKGTYRRLGQRGLQLVKLVEAIVRLANDHIDYALCTSGALRACLILMFDFKLNSLLHLSVQRIILILIDGGATESTIHCLLVECGLLQNIMEVVREEASCAESREGEAATLIAGSCRPISGHAISIAQSIVAASQAEQRVNPDSSMDVSLMSQDVSRDEGETGDRHIQQSPQPPTLVKSVLTNAGLFEEWDAFVQSDLQGVLDRQSIYTNVDSSEVSADSAKISKMEAALESLDLQGSPWMKQEDDDDYQNNVFDDDDSDEDDDDDDSDDDDNSDDEDGYHNYGSKFSSQIKVTAVVREEANNTVDFEDDEFEIGDQFAHFDSTNRSDNDNTPNFADFSSDSSSSFEANFDNIPQADFFGADFESPQFDAAPSFEANFDSASMGDDLFADFAKEATADGQDEKPDSFFSTSPGLKEDANDEAKDSAGEGDISSNSDVKCENSEEEAKDETPVVVEEH